MQKKNKILLIMSVAILLGYLPWHNYSAVVTHISADFGLTPSDTGLILSAFQLGYVIIVVITGSLADKVGPKKVLAWATLLCGVFALLFVFFAQGLVSILLFRLLTGLSAGAIYVPGMSLLAGWFPPSERGKAVGAYTGAMTAAHAGGYFVASPLAAVYGWQTGMLATSIPVFLGAFLVFVFVKECPPESGLQFDGKSGLSFEGAPAKPAPVGGYIGPVLITSAYMGHMWELHAYWGWIGPFMTAVVVQAGMNAASGGMLAALIILLAAPAVYIMGTVADKIGRTKTILIAASCSLIPQFFFGFMLGMPVWMVVAVGMWIGFWAISDSAIYKAGLTDMISEDIRGIALGIQSAVGFFMTILAPLAFGTILDLLNPGVGIMDATRWGPCFLMLGIGACAAPAFTLVLRKTRQAKLMAGGKM